MPVFYLAALSRYRADSWTALTQLNKGLEGFAKQLSSQDFADKWLKLGEEHSIRLADIFKAAQPKADGSFGTGYLSSIIKKTVPKDTIYAIEAVTNTAFVADNIQSTIPGSWINCGGGGLGWSGGGALGIKLATEAENGAGKGKFVCCIVGDGTFLFTVPGSVYWISQRYNIPILTIVLNNKGWHAPKRSLLLVHPEGLASTATHEELNLSFAPTPHYADIAKAAAGGNLFAAKISRAEEVESVLKKAVEAVMGGTSAVLDCEVVSGC